MHLVELNLPLPFSNCVALKGGHRLDGIGFVLEENVDQAAVARDFEKLDRTKAGKFGFDELDDRVVGHAGRDGVDVKQSSGAAELDVEIHTMHRAFVQGFAGFTGIASAPVAHEASVAVRHQAHVSDFPIALEDVGDLPLVPRAPPVRPYVELATRRRRDAWRAGFGHVSDCAPRRVGGVLWASTRRHSLRPGPAAPSRPRGVRRRLRQAPKLRKAFDHG